MDKVSIIMSVYNREKTVAKSIESVLAQTYKNWELVIVNDCSTDKSDDIIRQYANKDTERIKYVVLPENKGAGYARWEAFNHLTGDFIMFLDSDDTYNYDMVETLFNTSRKHEADFVNCGFRYFKMNEKGEEETLSIAKPMNAVLYADQVFYIDEKQTGRFLTGSITRKNLWDDVEYCKRRFIEDMPPLNKILTKVNKRVTIDYIGYNYLKNPGSLMETADKDKVMLFKMLSGLDTMLWEKKRGKTHYFETASIFPMLAQCKKLESVLKEKFPEETNELDTLINEYFTIVKPKIDVK